MGKGSRAVRRLVVATLVLSAGCGTAPHLLLPEAAGTGRVALAAVLAAHPLGITDNIRAVSLGHGEGLSYHLVQIRDREPAHLHATHDLSVTLLRGTGMLYVRGGGQPMRPGDVAVLPRGTPHYFVNTGSAPAAALVIFAPPYDGTDQVPVAE